MIHDIFAEYNRMFSKKPGARLYMQADDDDPFADDEDADTDAEDTETDADADAGADSEDADTGADAEGAEDKEAAQEQQVQMVFSPELAAEFGNTMNKFTQLAAKVVKHHNIGKDDADRLQNLLAKIKALLEAGRRSV